VVVDLEHSPDGSRSRPRSVRGIVVTTGTADRLSPPEPSSGIRVGFSARADRLPASYRHDPSTGGNWHNDGSPIMDKGHIMAIELGGPDVGENIVPQLSDVQRHGTWRRMEHSIRTMAEALSDSDCLFFTAVLSYSRELRDRVSVAHRVLTPSRFRVTVHTLKRAGLPQPPHPDRISLSGAPETVMFDGPLHLGDLAIPAAPRAKTRPAPAGRGGGGAGGRRGAVQGPPAVRTGRKVMDPGQNRVLLNADVRAGLDAVSGAGNGADADSD
jgi:hypothetical protein